jgi:hypothetical protein
VWLWRDRKSALCIFLSDEVLAILTAYTEEMWGPRCLRRLVKVMMPPLHVRFAAA